MVVIMEAVGKQKVELMNTSWSPRIKSDLNEQFSENVYYLNGWYPGTCLENLLGSRLIQNTYGQFMLLYNHVKIPAFT